MDLKMAAKKNRARGSAAAGGINYQAAVTAIAFVHMARGAPLGWMDAGNDIPIAVSAEAGSTGDDIQIVTQDGNVLHVQVKKRSDGGDVTCSDLVDLAAEVHGAPNAHAFLLVGPLSSAVVRNDLASAVRRIGEPTQQR